MAFSKNNLPLEFPRPTKVKFLACCDLDETYIPYAKENKHKGGIEHLEKFMIEHAIAKGIMLGWITRTNLNSALRKAYNYISHSPHFLCCSLGTEFYWIRDGVLVPSKSWEQRIIKSGYSHENVNKIIKEIERNHISIEKQPKDYQGAYKISFYY
ncbi:HAD family hydrolase [Actinobacillus vicugnae]|uniref:HAD family hydrolase n=1 Tax=Actinobacillus vicugnae TaxID=2573093 RepID=UPI001FCB63BE|nr:HAD family hydrolase [Actinobacillus vicugnae]